MADRARIAAKVLVWLETALADLRYGARQLRQAPVLAGIAVLSLALGIGANTAIFTLINAVMLQSLPVRDPGRLALFYDGISTGEYTGGNPQTDEFSYPFAEYLRAHNDAFESLAPFRQGDDTVSLHLSGSQAAGPGEQATVHLVAGDYFHVLGVGAAAGRVLSPADDSLAAARVAVLSYRFWRDRFRLDPGAIGRSVVLNGTPFVIAGVADHDFFGERVRTAPDFFLPLASQAAVLRRESWLDARDVYWLNLVGRLKPGWTLKRAETAVNVRFQQFYLEQNGTHLSADARRKIENTHLRLKPGGSGISGLRYLYAKPLQILMAVVAVVLLIACANIATLLLARASARRPEFMARLALGASRARLLRQVLTESVQLSAMGGVAGALFAWWGVKLLLLLLHVDAVLRVRPNLLVLTYTLALSIVTGIFFGVFPAWRFSRLELRPGSGFKPASIWKGRLSAAHALILLQVALSLSLLLGAGLLAHSLFVLERQNIGFRRDNILVIRTDASLAGYQTNELAPLYRSLGERLSQLPGVTVASMARFTPESGHSSSGNFSLEGYTTSQWEKMSVDYLPVAPHFFETMGIRLLFGRAINERDTSGAPPVAIVNQTFVDRYLSGRYLPGRKPLGQHISLGSPFAPPGAEIVGVVADSKYFDLREQVPPMAFFPLWQKPVSEFEMIIRTAAAPASVTAEVRQAVRQVSSKLPLLRISTLDAQIESSLDQQKLITELCSAFGVVALLLASIGIYGMLAYAVAGRTTEIGVRMAVGAQRSDVVWMVLRDSLVLIALGLAVGLPLALGSTRWLKSFLFGVREIDPLAIASTVGLIVALALLASYLPARRAARIDPIRALRHE